MLDLEKMIGEQIVKRGIDDTNVLKALRKVDRKCFVPEESNNFAYEDHPISIGCGQTISQPYIVAYMTAAGHLSQTDRVLEIGTGSGYQTAILANIASQVYTLETIHTLAESSRQILGTLGFNNIFFKCGDGYQGWEEHAPFDVIIVTAAPEIVPEQLINQLKIGGRLVIPLGLDNQKLYLMTKTEQGLDKEYLLPVKFVPMVK